MKMQNLVARDKILGASCSPHNYKALVIIRTTVTVFFLLSLIWFQLFSPFVTFFKTVFFYDAIYNFKKSEI